MIILYSEAHRQRDARTELHGGMLVPPFERPERMDMILAAMAGRALPAPVPPEPQPWARIAAVHAADYLTFLEGAWDAWAGAGNRGEAMPTVWPSRRMARAVVPEDIEGRLGWYALAGETAISPGTWAAARAAADVALTGAARLASGARAAFALTRPPGHHAAQDMYGGYCFLNNAALAAQALRDDGAARVAVLDVDFHHGNGTQAIFYDRADVFFASLHGDPLHAFPHFLGGAEETGRGPGEGANVNYPLPRGTGWAVWAEALEDALARIARHGAEALVVSLGVDTYTHDPIGFFALDGPDFTTLGRRLGRVGVPVLFVMEGGYAIDAIGENVANVLEGYAEVAPR
ncbi:MAG: histone deacetylase family protein [Pseudomonadota bacterium]